MTADILLVGVTLGRGARMLLGHKLEAGKQVAENRKFEVGDFLMVLVVLLVFSSWWHCDPSANDYHGLRWVGLWKNPNIYGMLMGAGFVLAAGLLVATEARKDDRGNADASFWPFSRCLCTFAATKGSDVMPDRARATETVPVILLIAALMMGIGLLFSYSRGSWLGAAIGLLYLTKACGRFKRRFVLPGTVAVGVAVWFFWSATPDTAPLYLKRLDFSRPSAQHRVAAWRGAFEIMRDHPFGVGWNKAVDTYKRNYLTPKDGAAAITTNDFLMLGTQLGIPGLACFLAYVGLCFRNQKAERRTQKSAADRSEGRSETAKSGQSGIRISELGIKTACRAGALAMLVAFWFDGGLFTLATASVFWILLELGAATSPHKTNLASANHR